MRSFFLVLFCICFGSLQAQEEDFNVYAEQTNVSIRLYADNTAPYPQSTKLTLNLKGLKVTKKQAPYYVVEAGRTKQLLVELIIPKNRYWSYDFQYLYFKGDVVNAKHDDSYVYRLPYPEGVTYKISQGYNGNESHFGENALDFDMRSGSDIVAARPGIVAQIKEDSNSGCPDQSCATQGNYVTILHDDGTFADYYHLQQNGALVNPGEEVSAGQVIGKSGNTGWASGPHLHFIVYKRLEKRRETYRTLFRTGKSEGTYLEEARSYKAVK